MFTKNIFKDFIYPIAVFSGGMIGVGFLALPYVALQSGIWIVLGYFIAISALIIAINLIFCEISLKTPDFKRFPGFAGYHLGKWGWFLAMILSIVGSFGVLLACLLVGSQFFASLAMPVFGGQLLYYILLYSLITGVLIFLGIKIIKRLELFVLLLLFIAILVIFFEGFYKIQISNFLVSAPVGQGMWQRLLLPYGPILFALYGLGLVPEVEEMIIGKKKSLKKIIFIGTLAVTIFYVLFTLLILGITGSNTTQAAFLGLKSVMGDGAVFISLLVGIFATMIGFVTQAIILKKVFMYDLNIKHWQALVITCVTPLILLLLGFTSFIPLLSFLGGFVLGISGIMVLLMYKKIGGKNIVVYPLSFIFLLGLVYQVCYSIK